MLANPWAIRNAAPAAPCRTPEEGATAAATLSVGLAVALGAVVMAFASVLLAYAIIRVQAPSWPPPGEVPTPPLWPWPALATGAALAGSAAMRRATAHRLAGGLTRPGQLLPPLLLAMAAGVTFMMVQSFAWRWLLHAGVRPDSGLVGSVLFALTIFHALHAGAALCSWRRCWRAPGAVPPSDHRRWRRSLPSGTWLPWPGWW